MACAGVVVVLDPVAWAAWPRKCWLGVVFMCKRSVFALTKSENLINYSETTKQMVTFKLNLVTYSNLNVNQLG